MRVLYRVPYPYFFSQHEGVGGHVAHSLGVVGGLVNDGHDVTVLGHEDRAAFEKRGAEFVAVTGQGRGPVWRQMWLWRFFRRSRRLMNQRSFDFTYTRYSASATPHLWWALNWETTPSVLEINSLGSQRATWMSWLDRRAICAASMPFVVSRAVKEWIAEVLGSEVGARVRVVLNAVEDTRFRPVPEARHDGVFQCAFAGLIKPYYGLECLVDAAKLLPSNEFSFHIFGAGPFDGELQSYARGVDNVFFEGEVPFEDVPKCLQEMDCLLHTTSPKWAFQSPTKIFEYMAIGRPIVAARTDSTKRILAGGRFGRLYEMESPPALRDAIRDVHEDYLAALDRARAAQTEVREHHRWIHRVRSIVRGLTSMADEQP